MILHTCFRTLHSGCSWSSCSCDSPAWSMRTVIGWLAVESGDLTQHRKKNSFSVARPNPLDAPASSPSPATPPHSSMASPLRTTAATAAMGASSTACLGCLARPSLLAAARSARVPMLPVTILAVQTRGKKMKREHGVVVRLLEDVSHFGRKGEPVLHADQLAPAPPLTVQTRSSASSAAACATSGIPAAPPST